MAFISGTWIMNDTNIILNVDQIVAVSDNEGKAVIHTNIPNREGYVQFWVHDSYETVLSKIALATKSGAF